MYRGPFSDEAAGSGKKLLGSFYTGLEEHLLPLLDIDQTRNSEFETHGGLVFLRSDKNPINQVFVWLKGCLKHVQQLQVQKFLHTC